MLSTPTLITGSFPGIYCSSLPGLCWAADSRRLVLDTAQRSQQVRAAMLGWQGGTWGDRAMSGLCWTLPLCP